MIVFAAKHDLAQRLAGRAAPARAYRARHLHVGESHVAHALARQSTERALRSSRSTRLPMRRAGRPIALVRPVEVRHANPHRSIASMNAKARAHDGDFTR